MRILHAPSNVAGMAGLLARAQRDLGADATSVEYLSHPHAFPVDTRLGLDRGDSLVKKASLAIRFALHAVQRYDVFHFYFGHTLFPYPYPDLRVLRALGKRIVFHFCGCDIRNRTTMLTTRRLSACTECVTRACLRRHHPDPSAADLVFVSTPDLLEFAPGATLAPGPIDLEQWRPRGPRERPISSSDPIRILHAPSDRFIKGTRHLLDAVGRLKSAGYPVELALAEGVESGCLPSLARSADLAVDQLMAGVYGTVSIELMATGVPVVCRIDGEAREHYPDDLPIVSAGPENVYDVLESLVRHPGTWQELGRKGVEYVRREHEMHVVAARFLHEYASAGTTAPERALPAVSRLPRSTA